MQVFVEISEVFGGEHEAYELSRAGFERDFGEAAQLEQRPGDACDHIANKHEHGFLAREFVEVGKLGLDRDGLADYEFRGRGFEIAEGKARVRSPCPNGNCGSIGKSMCRLEK